MGLSNRGAGFSAADILDQPIEFRLSFSGDFGKTAAT